MSREPDAGLSPDAIGAPIFAALGDETRLHLVRRLCEGRPCSIAELTGGLRLTRQAVTKHLRTLEGVGLVRGSRRGREVRFELRPESFDDARNYLETVSLQWDRALARLKLLVESDGAGPS